MDVRSGTPVASVHAEGHEKVTSAIVVDFWHKIRGYLAVGVGLAACPCHLPLTLPLLLALIGGTALGAWLATHQAILFVVSAGLFVGGLALGLRWLNSRACELRLETVQRERTG